LPSLRDVKRRIASVENTKKITKAQEIVAATKVRKAQQKVQGARPYAEKMLEVLQTTAERASEYRHPWLEQREVKQALLILITSDRGLAGGLNVNTIRAANRFMNDRYPRDWKVVTIGRKGREFMTRFQRELVGEVTGIPDLPGEKETLAATRVAIDEFNEGRVDAVTLAYSKAVSTMKQEPQVRVLIPVEIPGREGEREQGDRQRDDNPGGDYIYEPDPEGVLDALLPRYVETQVYQALLENQASEHSARMIAMRNATENAGDLIEDLTLTMNKVRQTTITTELMEIVGGAEALRQ
jgi:F-type H+-transporting ATPase subunit gamma